MAGAIGMDEKHAQFSGAFFRLFRCQRADVGGKALRGRFHVGMRSRKLTMVSLLGAALRWSASDVA
jgi:hypothetical protein